MLIFKVKNTTFIVRHPTFFGGLTIEYSEFNDFINIIFGHSLISSRHKLDGGIKIINMKKKLRKLDDPSIKACYGKQSDIMKQFYDFQDKFISNLKRLGLISKKMVLPDVHLVKTLEEIRARKEQLENINLALHDLKRVKSGLVNFVDDMEKMEE